MKGQWQWEGENIEPDNRPGFYQVSVGHGGAHARVHGVEEQEELPFQSQPLNVTSTQRQTRCQDAGDMMGQVTGQTFP